jgi:hypothetical protein
MGTGVLRAHVDSEEIALTDKLLLFADGDFHGYLPLGLPSPTRHPREGYPTPLGLRADYATRKAVALIVAFLL